MSILRDINAAVSAVAHDLRAESILYTTTTGHTINLAAVPTNEQRPQNADLITRNYDQLEWLIKAADLIANGQRIVPARGDRITWTTTTTTDTTTTDTTRVYELLPPGEDDLYRPRDPAGTQYRCHCKLVSISNTTT